MTTSKEISPQLQNELKKQAAMAAAKYIPNNSVVGLGSGSTLAFFIHEIGRKVRDEKMNIIGVPTSFQSRMIAAEYGMIIRDPMEVESVDIAVDGADEVDPNGQLIKGAGAAHVMERIVAAMADKFIVIVDESKMVDNLGSKFAVPLEVVPPAMSSAIKTLKAMGSSPVVRSGTGKMGPVISDFGNLIIDAKFDKIPDALKLDNDLNNIPGVVGHGLFINMTTQTIIASLTDGKPTIKEIQYNRS